MIDRPVALTTVLVALALVAAQIVNPEWMFPHGEPYALALAVAIWILVAYTARAAGGADGPRGRWLALATAGGALIAVTGLASGLLGADPQTIARAPGSVQTLGDLGAAAFFPLVDAEGIARGDARVGLRRKGRATLEVAPQQRRLVGTSVLVARPHLAAYVEAYDGAGRRLTITQPTNPAFLSPVLQFATSVTVGDRTLPADEFAVPSAHRRVTAVYVDARDAVAMRAQRLGGKSVVLFSVRGDAGASRATGIDFAASGGAAHAGGLELRVTIGTYPELLVGSAPLPASLWLGGLAVVLGAVLALAPRRGTV